MSTIPVRIRTLICEHLGVDEARITPEARLVEDLGADSLDAVELVMSYEDEFHITLGDDEAEKIVTVQDAVDYVERALASKAGER